MKSFIALCAIVSFTLFSCLVFADDLTVVSSDSYSLESSARVNRTVYLYTYRAKVKNNGFDTLTGVCGVVQSTNSAVVVVDSQVCFPDLPRGGAAVPSSDTFSLKVDRTRPFSDSDLSWTYSSISMTAEPSSLAIQTYYSSPLSYHLTVNMSKKVSTPYTISFDQEVVPSSDVSVTSRSKRQWQAYDFLPLLVAENVTASSPIPPQSPQPQIVATARIEETGQEVPVKVPITATNTPPPPVLPVPSCSPAAQFFHTPTQVSFWVPVFTGGQAPSSVSIDQWNGTDWTSIATLLDDGMNGDYTAGDLIYTGSATLPYRDEGPLLFRASATGFTPSGSLTFTVTPFPTTPDQTDPLNVITNDAGQNIVADRILVAFDPGTTSDEIKAILAPIGTVVGMLGSVNYYQVYLASLSVQDALDLLRGNSKVKAAQADYVGGVLSLSDNPTEKPVGWADGASITDIGAQFAWTTVPPVTGVGYTGAGVMVAILDTGVLAGHQDFKYTPDGPSSVTYSGPVKPALGPNPPDSSNSVNGHGTDVAGIIGAKVNEMGTIGVAPDANIRSIKVCGSDTSCASSDVAQGLYFAVAPPNPNQPPAKIINMSIYTCRTYNKISGDCTSSCSCTGANSDTDTVVANAVKAASDKALVVVAAGNFTTELNRTASCMTVPASCPGVLSVAAIGQDPLDALWGGSYFGSWVQLAAPGTNIYSTNKFNSWVGTNTGTSFAAPFVSGAAALIMSAAPGISPADVQSQLLFNAIPVGVWLNDTFVPSVAYGRVNVENIFAPPQ